MKRTLALCALFITGYTSFAQAPVIEWQKTYGGPGTDYGYGVDATADGGYIVVGEAKLSGGDVTTVNGDYDIWVTKLDAQGNLLWQKSYGGSGTEWAYIVKQTADGGYIVAGYTSSNNGDVTTSHGGRDYWLFKIDSAGTMQWQKTYGGSGEDTLLSLQTTTDGGYLAVGSTKSNNGDVTENKGNSDVWVVKVNATGDMQWQKTYGGYSEDKVQYAIQTNDGNYIIAGDTFSTDGDVTGNHGGTDGWVIKLDSTGNLIWQKCIGGTLNDFFSSVQQNSSGYLLVGGSSSFNSNTVENLWLFDFYLVQLDENGNVLWEKNYGGTGSDTACHISPAADGGYLILGHTTSNDGNVTNNHGLGDIWLIKINIQGNLQWQKTYGGSSDDGTQLMVPSADGGYTIAGATLSNDGDVTGNEGDYDFWIVKLTAEGTTGLSQNQKNTFNLYPNPNNGTFTINADTDVTNAAINVYSAMGQLVYTGKVTGTTVAIPNLSAGVYQVQLTTGQAAYSQKLIVK
jgi:hypothetical protein